MQPGQIIPVVFYSVRNPCPENMEQIDAAVRHDDAIADASERY